MAAPRAASLSLINSSYFSLLSHLLNSTTHSLSHTQQAHALIFKTGLSNQTHFATKLIALYANSLHFSDSSLLLDSVPVPNIFSFTTLISASSKSHHFGRTLHLLRQMLSHGLQPDNFIIPSILKACTAVFDFETGRQVHGFALVSGYALDSFVQSSLVHMYVKFEEMSNARKLFDEMPQRNVVCWSAMVSGYARMGHVDHAKELFNEMISSGVEPNLVSWNGLIAGFNHNGLFLESVMVFQDMHSQGFKPDGTSISSVLPAASDLEDLEACIRDDSSV